MKAEDILIYFEENIYDNNFYPIKDLFLIGFDHIQNNYFHGSFLFYHTKSGRFRVLKNNVNFLINIEDILKISEENISDYLIFW